MRNLWEYTAARSSLLNKRIYLLVSAHQENSENEARGRTNLSSSLHPFSALLLYINTQTCVSFTELEFRGPDLLLQLIFSHQRKNPLT